MASVALRVVAGGALLALLAACGARDKPAAPIRPVQLTQVKVGSAADFAVFAGEVRPRFEADLGFRIGGKIVARYVDMGARVKKGDVLARLDPSDVGLQADAARAQVAATETEYRFAQAEYDRYKDLLKEKFISASALDAKRNTLDANRAKYEQAKANLAVAQNQASYATLVASDDGVITAIAADAGQVVAAGAPVMKLARAGEREVSISVPENRIQEVTGAKQLVVALWANPQKTYPARVREVSPAVDAVTRTFAVRVSILESDAAVQLGMTANVGVLGTAAGSSAVLPLTSIYQQDGKPAVWRFDPATRAVRLAPVVIGQYREDGVVVTSGVAQGEWIVAAGVHKLTPGQVVRPYDAGPVPASPESAPGH
jgi:multidrug efflux system membrane fusion protein